MKKTYGYCRVSSKDQNLDRQFAALLAYGVDERDIITDKESGKDFQRSGYLTLRDKLLREGDSLVVKELDRLGRDYGQIKDEWRYLEERGIDIVVLDTPIINTANKSDLERKLISNIVFELMAYTAEKEREKINQRRAEGIAIAKSKGKHLGRPKAEYPKNWNETIALWQKQQITAKEAMELLDIKRTTFYKLVNSYQ